MFKSLLMIVFSLYLLEAKSITVDYRVEFGILGDVAKVNTKYYDNRKTYILDTNISTVGMLAKAATSNLKERHICKGFITKRGLLVVTSYQMIKSYGDYKSMTLYTVNHKTKKVTKTYKKWETQSHKNDRKIQDYTYELNYYARDDMVTLFLNLATHIKDKQKPNHYIFKAVGADKKNGRVDIVIPSSVNAKMMIDFLGKPKEGEWLMHLIMHRQLYNSKQGELMVRMGKDGIIEQAVLKDLIFFGDVRIIRK